jgi:hypothetical protein
LYAKSGAVTHTPNRDFWELIVRGERPEIAACMVATLKYVHSDTQFSAVRWTEEATDTANVRESETDGRLTRSIRFVAQVRTRGALWVFSDPWKLAEISCVQHEEGSTDVQLHLLAR